MVAQPFVATATPEENGDGVDGAEAVAGGVALAVATGARWSRGRQLPVRC